MAQAQCNPATDANQGVLAQTDQSELTIEQRNAGDRDRQRHRRGQGLDPVGIGKPGHKQPQGQHDGHHAQHAQALELLLATQGELYALGHVGGTRPRPLAGGRRISHVKLCGSHCGTAELRPKRLKRAWQYGTVQSRARGWPLLQRCQWRCRLQPSRAGSAGAPE